MAEYIDREAALDIVNGWREQLIPTYGKNDEYVKCLETVAEHLETLPAADVVERKTGKWIYPSDIVGFGRCSECKALWDYSLMTNKYFKICPRCGSYNRGDDNV